MKCDKTNSDIIQQYFDSFSANVRGDVWESREETAKHLFLETVPFQQRKMVFLIDLAVPEIIASRGMEQVLGYKPVEFNLHKLHSQIHPNDIEKMINATNEAFAHIVEKKETYPLAAQLCLTYRIRHADGHYLHIEDTLSILSISSNGHPVKAVATYADISQIPFVEFTGHLSCPCNGFQSNFTTLDHEKTGLPQKDEAFNFTKRELEIIEFLKEGKSSVDISKELFISRHTVDKHRSNILEKAGASRTQQLLRFLS